MGGLRDHVQRARQTASLDVGAASGQGADPLAGGGRSAAQRVLHVGFSLQGPESQSAWKRRFGIQTTAPTETTLRTLRLTRCSLAHSIGGLLFAGGATVLFLESGLKQWLWLILLAMLVVVYGVASYWYAEHDDRFAMTRLLLIGGDLLVTGCLGLLLGFSAVVALLIPALVLLAALIADQRGALLAALVGCLVVMLLALCDLAGVAHLQLHLRPPVMTLCTLVGTLICLGWITWALLALLRRDRQSGVDSFASAEVARARIESDVHARQVQDGLLMLQQIVERSEVGDRRARASLREGELAPLATSINALLERQEQMSGEFLQHQRLERAVNELLALLEALHRGEKVGWPPATGTQVDRILALMRAPATPATTRKLPASDQEGASLTSGGSSTAAAVQLHTREGTSLGMAPRRISGQQ